MGIEKNEQKTKVHHHHRPAGIGKTTLEKKLGERLWMPVISRDEIKEGYVNTYGVKHDQLPPETNGLVSELFFGIVDQYLAHHISVVIEAAFQHDVWEPRMPKILDLASPVIVLCSCDATVAASRHLHRGLENQTASFIMVINVSRITGKQAKFYLRKLCSAEIQCTYNPSLDRWRLCPIY